jgi:pyruvate formate lyase activating enzyme
LKCSFCQNWTIAHKNPDTISLTPRQLVSEAVKYKAAGNIGIAYTYNEPSIWYEYVLDCSKLARNEGLVNVLVTNGFIGAEPLDALLPYIDAMNIDVKAYTASFYNKICGGVLDDIKRTVETSVMAGCHVEVTTLVIPDLNDSVAEIDEMCKWLSGISSDIPLHLSRFFPNYKMQDKPPTPEKTLVLAQQKAREYLKYVYIGNIW